MRNIRPYLSLLLMGALAATSCQDDFDNPALVEPESTWLADSQNFEIKTINEIKTEYWQSGDNYFTSIGEGTDGKHILVKGHIISSDASGNIYKSLVIQDETGALAMSINANSMNVKYRPGQEMVVDLTGMTIGKYSGLEQLGFPEVSTQYGNQTTFMPYEFFQEHIQLNGLPNLEAIDTITVKGAELIGGGDENLIKWQSQLIRFNNCYFEEGGETTFALDKETVSHVLVTEDNTKITVRTSGYSNFYSDMLPKGHGDVVGILGYYAGSSDTGNNWQLTLLDRNGCMNFGNPTTSPGGEDKPYTVDQAISILAGGGTATQVWTKGYIVGAVAPFVTDVTKNEDIQFRADPELDNTLVIASSPDCKDYTKCLVITLPQGSKLREYGNLVDHKENYGKVIELKGNFATVLGTYGITGNNGTASEFKIEGVVIPGDTTTEGNGTKENPYTVAQVIAFNPQSKDETASDDQKNVWVGGYIVGFFYNYEANFTATAAQASNILIAATPDVTDKAQTVCVQLVYDTDVRKALNLADNPGNLGKYVKVLGDILLYNNLPGVKNTSEYEIDGQSGGDEPNPPTPPTPSTATDADFNTMNNGTATPYYGTLTSTNGWVADNSNLLQGGDSDANPVFTVFGDASVFAVCLNGNTSKVGKLTSPTISGGIGTLTFDYCQPYSDTKAKLTVSIKQNGQTVASDVLENNGMTKLQKYTYSHAFNVSGDFTIEIVNDCPSAASSNKDRVAIWNLSWTK